LKNSFRLFADFALGTMATLKKVLVSFGIREMNKDFETDGNSTFLARPKAFHKSNILNIDVKLRGQWQNRGRFLTTSVRP
jgi:spore coat protein CotH